MLRNKFISAGISACILFGILTGCSSGPKVAGIEDSVAIETVKSASVQSVSVTSHNVEEITGSEYGSQYTVKDTVSVTYKAGDLEGLLPQTVSKEISFYLNSSTGAWENLSEKTTACTADNEALKGSNWKIAEPSEEVMNFLFADEAADGEIYIKLLKTMGLFAFNLEDENNTSSERFFQTVGTNGKFTLVGASGAVEKKFSITGGSVTDAGLLNLDIESDSGKITICFGDVAVPISEMEYDEATGKEVDKSKVYMDSLPVFEVTTTSIENGEWKRETGLKEGNNSPALSWEPVEGATKYAVFMIDTSTTNWLSWYVIVDKTTLDEGEFTDQSVYVGPYPPGTHTYEVYVLALADEPKPYSFPMDASGGDINAKANLLNIKADGTAGNVIAYGTIKAPYTAPELYYGYR